jgi:hypothetical protein
MAFALFLEVFECLDGNHNQVRAGWAVLETTDSGGFAAAPV